MKINISITSEFISTILLEKHGKCGKTWILWRDMDIVERHG
jgi:hypothetical protein